MKISVLGDFMIDEYVYSETNRISPEAPVLIADVKEIVEKPGGAGNVSQALINLQDEVQLIGLDDNENRISSLFDGHQCIRSFIKTELPAIRKTRIIANNHHLLRIDNEQIPDSIDIAKIKEMIKAIKEFNPDFIVISDYNKGFLKLILGHKEFCEFFNKFMRNRPTIADLKPKSFYLIQSSLNSPLHSILPNHKEILASADFCKDYYEAAVFWHDQRIAEHIIVTLGEKGASMIIGHHEENIPTEAVEVIDVCGCGDNVTAVYAHLLSRRWKPIKALERAVKAATITAQKLGTHPITADELASIPL